MQPDNHPAIDEAYDEIRRIVRQVTGAPVPEIGPQAFVPFPAGCDPVAYAMHEVAQLRRMVGGPSGQAGNAPGATREAGPAEPCWHPRADVYGGERGLRFRVETPGVALEDLAVTVCRHELIVRGRRSAPEAGEHLRPFVVEQPWGAFERRFPLPVWCSEQDVEAHYADGVLDVTIERSAESATERSIEIG